MKHISSLCVVISSMDEVIERDIDRVSFDVFFMSNEIRKKGTVKQSCM